MGWKTMKRHFSKARKHLEKAVEEQNNLDPELGKEPAEALRILRAWMMQEQIK